MARASARANSGVMASIGRIKIGIVIRYALLIGLGIVYTMPFIWMVSLSLKPFTDLNQIPPQLIPTRLAFENFPTALFQPMLYFPQFAINTVYYVGVAGLGELVSSAIVGYGFARMTFRGSGFLFG